MFVAFNLSPSFDKLVVLWIDLPLHLPSVCLKFPWLNGWALPPTLHSWAGRRKSDLAIASHGNLHLQAWILLLMMQFKLYTKHTCSRLRLCFVDHLSKSIALLTKTHAPQLNKTSQEHPNTVMLSTHGHKNGLF